jgi:hypothetical protein
MQTQCCIWINLTNGLQAIHDYGLSDYRIMRIQSTHCEQKRWSDVLASIPDEFLWNLAAGMECRVYDYGAHKPVPRAIWQGLEWAKYAITRRWTGEEITLNGRAKTMQKYFSEHYAKLTKSQKARLDYYGEMAQGIPIITSVTSATNRDGDKKWLWNCKQCKLNVASA